MLIDHTPEHSTVKGILWAVGISALAWLVIGLAMCAM